MEKHVTNSDDYLVQQFIDGDRDAFSTLVTRHKNDIYRFIFYRLQDVEQAADLTQDVFVKLFQSAERYIPSGKFKSWLLRIAHNLCIDEYRKKKYLRHISLEQEPRLVSRMVDTSQESTHRAEHHELQVLLTEGLQRLPAIYREALTLCQYQGLRYHEIAEIQNCPVGTVKSRIHAAMKQLKEFLKEKELI
jgi:RNA polymerase sigma-70 factor (ECF subfamily)